VAVVLRMVGGELLPLLASPRCPRCTVVGASVLFWQESHTSRTLAPPSRLVLHWRGAFLQLAVFVFLRNAPRTGYDSPIPRCFRIVAMLMVCLLQEECARSSEHAGLSNRIWHIKFLFGEDSADAVAALDACWEWSGCRWPCFCITRSASWSRGCAHVSVATTQDWTTI